MKNKLATVLAAALMLALAVVPVFAGLEFTLAVLSARTTSAVGTAVDVTRCRQANVLVRVTAGSGTVTVFKVFLVGSVDGTNLMELPCDTACKDGGACTANTQNIVSETAVVTSAEYAASCPVAVDEVAAGWTITGTSPSETFEVVFGCK